jgi:formamidopyrimidine-DNA glycosylase
MTGSFRVPDRAALPLATGPRPGETAWPPRFTKLRLRFDDGSELAFTNARRLGRLRLREDPETEPPLSRLGFDPLLDLPGPRTFQRLLARRQARIKGVLLDQSFAAGVGNWIADEVLYQAGIDPRRRADDLDEAEVRRLRSKLDHVVKRAVAVDADKTRFPRTWLFHRRWGKNAEARTARGESIEHVVVAGRTTAWVPAVQR